MESNGPLKNSDCDTLDTQIDKFGAIQSCFRDNSLGALVGIVERTETGSDNGNFVPCA